MDDRTLDEISPRVAERAFAYADRLRTAHQPDIRQPAAYAALTEVGDRDRFTDGDSI